MVVGLQRPQDGGALSLVSNSLGFTRQGQLYSTLLQRQTGKHSAVEPYYMSSWWSHRQVTTAHTDRQNGSVYFDIQYLAKSTMSKGTVLYPAPKFEGEKIPKCNNTVEGRADLITGAPCHDQTTVLHASHFNQHLRRSIPKTSECLSPH